MTDKDFEIQTSPEVEQDSFTQELSHILDEIADIHPCPDDETAMLVIGSPSEGDDGVGYCSPRQYAAAVAEGTAMGIKIVNFYKDIASSRGDGDESGRWVLDDLRESLAAFEERILLSR